MTDDTPPRLSRRRILGTLGALGAGAALGGSGTTAFFSDEETFKNNRIVAGDLDLKVDWQQTYTGPRGTVPLNAYPDHDGDGLQSVERDGEIHEYLVNLGAPITIRCDELASGDRLPADVFDAPNRSFAHGGSRVDQDHLVELTDVKPGDEGEITFSLHGCGDIEGAYLWMTGALTGNTERSVTEPEAADPDDPNSTVASESAYEASLGDRADTYGELAETIRVTIWVDLDCDNRFEPAADEEPLSIPEEAVLLEDVPLRQALWYLSRGPGLPVDCEPTTEERSCMPGNSQFCIGFRWWLPPDHANEVQSDGVSFDLGFYTEQCRNNDGAGLGPERLEATLGTGDYSEISYERNLGMALRYGNSPYEDGSIGRAPYEQELHPSTDGYGQHFAYANRTTYEFFATLEPGSATELVVTGPGQGYSVTDGDLGSGSYVTDSVGGPTEGDLAVTAKAQSANLSPGDSVTVTDLRVNDVPADPGGVTAEKGGTELAYLALTDLDFTVPVEVTGNLTFDVDDGALPTDDPHDVLTAVGIDWR